MGELRDITFAIIICMFIAGILSSAFYNASTDVHKQEFTTYADFSGGGLNNYTGATTDQTNQSIDDITRITTEMERKISQSSSSAKDQSGTGLLNMFGLSVQLAIYLPQLLLAIVLESMNFVGALTINSSEIAKSSGEWGYLFVVFNTLAFSGAIILVVFIVVSIVLKWDI